MNNWKTTVFGCVAAVGSYLANSTNPTLVLIGQILTALSLVGLGYHSTDKGK